MGAFAVTLVVVAVCSSGIGWCLAKYRDSRAINRLEYGEMGAVAAKNRTMADLEREIARNQELERQNNRLVAELTAIAVRPPHVIDQAPMIRAIGEAIASAYGPPPTPSDTPPEQRTLDYSKIVPATTQAENRQWFPDVEMDQWLENLDGYPTTGGWVNHQTNSLVPLPDGQEPVHRLLDDGRVVRTDAQPMFRAGDGQVATPPGGLE